MNDNTVEFKAKAMPASSSVYTNVDDIAIVIPAGRGVDPFVEYRITLTRIEPEPLPCPHCGGQAHVITEEHGLDIDVYLVWCDSGTCGAKGPTMCTPMKAIERWNRRA